VPYTAPNVAIASGLPSCEIVGLSSSNSSAVARCLGLSHSLTQLVNLNTNSASSTRETYCPAAHESLKRMFFDLFVPEQGWRGTSAAAHAQVNSGFDVVASTVVISASSDSLQHLSRAQKQVRHLSVTLHHRQLFFSTHTCTAALCGYVHARLNSSADSHKDITSYVPFRTPSPCDHSVLNGPHGTVQRAHCCAPQFMAIHGLKFDRPNSFHLLLK
jgi:hypothetical protein